MEAIAEHLDNNLLDECASLEARRDLWIEVATERMAEIKRLRAALLTIADWPFPFMSGKGIEEAREYARAAIEKAKGGSDE